MDGRWKQAASCEYRKYQIGYSEWFQHSVDQQCLIADPIANGQVAEAVNEDVKPLS